MLSKNNVKTLVLSILILCNLILVPNHAAGNASGLDNQKIDDMNAPIVRTAARGNEWFVSDSGTGTDCSRTNPGPLQYCVETKAQSGDTVYVHEGHYHTEDPDDNLLLIQKSLHLIGSCNWSNTGPISCTPQNTFSNTNFSDLNGENERRVIAITGPDISVTIENFIIHQGNADDKQPNPPGILGAGGGVYAGELDSFVLKNNYIWSNRASDTGTSICDFGYGGGVYADDVQYLDIRDNIIIFNSASSPVSTGRGGGLYVSYCGDGGKVNIESNRFHENMIGDTTTSSRGAGAYLHHVNNLSLDDNIFEYHNHTVRRYWTKGSALILHFAIPSSVDHNIFKYNYGESLVEIVGLSGDFTRNTFWENEASYDLWVEHYNDFQIINNFFGKLYGRGFSSLMGSDGTRGGISTIINILSGHGGPPQVNIINNTFALAEYAIQVGFGPIVDIKRNIFTELTKKAIDIDSANTTVDVNENLFWNNAANGETGSTSWVANPKLVDLWNGDFHIQTGSAAIDKVSGGFVDTDIDYQHRPIGFGIDLGADEYGFSFFLPLFTR